MEFGKELKKAMIDNGIGGAKQLAEIADMSYNKVIRALNSDSSSRLVDVVKLGDELGLKLKFTSKGEG
jgi:DNA-binding phage protein